MSRITGRKTKKVQEGYDASKYRKAMERRMDMLDPENYDPEDPPGAELQLKTVTFEPFGACATGAAVNPQGQTELSTEHEEYLAQEQDPDVPAKLSIRQPLPNTFEPTPAPTQGAPSIIDLHYLARELLQEAAKYGAAERKLGNSGKDTTAAVQQSAGTPYGEKLREFAVAFSNRLQFFFLDNDFEAFMEDMRLTIPGEDDEVVWRVTVDVITERARAVAHSFASMHTGEPVKFGEDVLIQRFEAPLPGQVQDEPRHSGIGMSRSSVEHSRNSRMSIMSSGRNTSRVTALETSGRSTISPTPSRATNRASIALPEGAIPSRKTHSAAASPAHTPASRATVAQQLMDSGGGGSRHTVASGSGRQTVAKGRQTTIGR